MNFHTAEKAECGASEIAQKVFPSEGRSTMRDFIPDALISAVGGSSFSERLGRWLKNASTRRWGNIELHGELDAKENMWKYLIDIERPKPKKNRSDGFLEGHESAAA